MCRILGLDIGIKHLQDVTEEAMTEQANELCKFCGHWNGGERQHTWMPKCDKQMSPYWLRAVERYKESPPTLTTYGEGDV